MGNMGSQARASAYGYEKPPLSKGRYGGVLEDLSLPPHAPPWKGGDEPFSRTARKTGFPPSRELTTFTAASYFRGGLGKPKKYTRQVVMTEASRSSDVVDGRFSSSL